MRRLVLLTLLCLFAGGLVVAWGFWAQEESLLVGADPLDEPAPADGQPPPVATATTPAAPGTGDTDEAPQDDHRTAVVDSEAPVGTPEGPLVRVLRGDQGVPGALVWYVGYRAARERDARAGAKGVPNTDWPRRYGHASLTGDEGRVRLPRIDDDLVVSAIVGDEFAFTNVPRQYEDAEFALHLEHDETLAVDVVGADATPVPDVQVRLFQGKGYPEGEHFSALPTDAHGRAVFRHFQSGRKRGQPGYAAVAMVATATPAAAAFTDDPLPQEPLRIVLPATGKVALRVVDATGQRVLSPGRLFVRSLTAADFASTLPLSRRYDELRLDKAPGAVDPVHATAVGAVLAVVARVGDVPPFEVKPVQGPAATGETATADVVLPPATNVLAGRLLGADGSPLADTTATVALLAGNRGLRTSRVQTVADGRFDWVFGETIPEPVVFAAQWTGEGGAVLVATAALAAMPRGGRRELGDLQLAAQPLLAGGDVVDDRGEPVAEADVQLQAQVLRNNEVQWSSVPLTATRTDAAGMFALRGLQPIGPLQLSVRKNGYQGVSLPLPPGATVHVVLPRYGILRGRALLPPWVTDGMCTLRLEPAPGQGLDARAVPLRRRREGDFQFNDLRPGLYAAVVQVRNLPAPLLRLDGLRIAPGDNADPRLQPLDLRERLFQYRLRAVNAGGEPVAVEAAILARFDGPTGERTQSTFRLQRGRAVVVTTADLLEATFVGRGIPPTTLLLGPGDRDVCLPLLPPLQILVPGLRAVCGTERRIRVSMVLQGETGLPQAANGVDQRTGEDFAFNRWDLGKSNGGWLGPGDATEVPLAAPGTYEVVLRIYEGASEGGQQAQVPLGNLDVRFDGSRPLQFALAADLGLVQKALQQLARNAQGTRRR